MQIKTVKEFIHMPWKNGGGTTTELYCIKNSETEEIFFRISAARVSQSGPFSIFKNLDRILMLTSGSGFSLKFKEKRLTLDQCFEPIYFQGEEEIQCDLINEECDDFNIMTNRSYGKSSLTVTNLCLGAKVSSKTGQLFIYVPKFKTLHLLNTTETFINNYEDALQIFQIYLFDIT